jgi:hypothetical protein
MKLKFKYGKQKEETNEDPRDLVDYWFKLAPTIWQTKSSKIIALKRFIALNKTKPENKKSNEAKIFVLRTLIKKHA